MKTQFVKLKSITKTKVDYVYDFTVENVHRIIAKHPKSKNAFYTSNCSHPDIEEFISAKLKSNYLSKFNISVGIIEGFMEAVKNDDYWNLEFPDTFFEKYDEEWDGDIVKWKKKGYPVITVKKIKARELWNKILLSTYKRNEPGVLFLDLANKLNPLSYCEKINASNPCVVGDTLVYTNKGWLKIKNIAKLYERGKTGNLKILTRNFKKNFLQLSDLKWCGITKKDEEIYRVVFDNNQYLEVNLSHKFYNENFKKVKVKDLKIGDKIVSFQKLLKIKNIIKLNKKEDVYDLTCKPNYNFFAILGNEKEDENEEFNIQKDDRLYNSILCVDCGEILMSDFSACLLGTINLTRFVEIKDNKAYFNFDKFKKIIFVAVRFLDNIIDITNYPLKEYEKELKSTRRIGLGIMGLGSVAYMLGLKYGNNKEFLDFVEKIMKIKQEVEILASVELGKEKGNFPKFNKDKFFNTYFWKNYLNISKEVKEKIEKIGYMRNGSWSSNQPNGNTSILAGIVSGGIEPVFMKEYKRWVVLIPEEIKKLKNKGIIIPDVFKNEWFETEIFKFYKKGDEEVLKGIIDGVEYEIDKNRGIVKAINVIDYGYKFVKENNLNYSDDIFVTIEDLTVDDHLEVLKIISKYITHNSSKTINLPNDYNFEDFKKVYEKAYHYNIKGLTTYRLGTMTNVLEKKENIEIKQLELEKIFNNAKNKIIPENVKLPDEYYARGYIIRDKLNKKKYYVHIAFTNNKYNKPFAIFINTNNKESSEIADKTIEDMEVLAYKMGIKKELIEEQINKYRKQNNIVKIARAIGFLLRHNVPILEIINILNNYKIGTLPFYIKILLKKFIPNNFKTDEKCKICGSNLIYMEGCKLCKNCGWSKCD